MASVTILSDNGATSGSAGLKTSGGNDGTMLLQTTTSGGTPTTAISISNTQVVTYTNQPTYTGGTANGVLYLNGSKAVTSGTALVFDGTNLGVGVTPSAWETGRKVVQVGTAAIDTNVVGQAVLRANNYYNGTNNKYIFTGYASAYEQYDGAHRWYTAASGTAGNNLSFTQSLTISANSELFLNTTNSGGYSSVYTTFALGVGPSGGSIIQFQGAAAADGAHIRSDRSGSTFQSLTIETRSGTSAPLVLGTNGSERARLNAGAAIFCLSGGNTSATGTGIAFPASYNASSDVNTLDDYEEGDWTPRLSGSTSGNYTPGGLNGGRYVKIGKMVWATATLNWTAVVSGYSGNLCVAGLPFTSAGQRAVGSMGAVASGLSFTAGYGEWVYLVDPGYTFVYIIQNSTTGSGYSHLPTVGSSGIVYALSIVYEAA